MIVHTLFKNIEEEIWIEMTHRVKTDIKRKVNTPRTIVCRILKYLKL